MELSINIIGRGKVDKVVGAESTTLTATPDTGWAFRSYLIDDVEVRENPYTATSEANVSVVATFYMTIESYLKGKVGFEISQNALDAILLHREISQNADINDITSKSKELAYADMLEWAATSPSSYTGKKESDGGWSSTEASSTLLKSDKERFMAIANEIFTRYNDPKRTKPKIKIVNLNGKYR